jgi:hypothetical protein
MSTHHARRLPSILVEMSMRRALPAGATDDPCVKPWQADSVAAGRPRALEALAWPPPQC